jgi:hypothetical protein
VFSPGLRFQCVPLDGGTRGVGGSHPACVHRQRPSGEEVPVHSGTRQRRPVLSYWRGWGRQEWPALRRSVVVVRTHPAAGRRPEQAGTPLRRSALHHQRGWEVIPAPAPRRSVVHVRRYPTRPADALDCSSDPGWDAQRRRGRLPRPCDDRLRGARVARQFWLQAGRDASNDRLPETTHRRDERRTCRSIAGTRPRQAALPYQRGGVNRPAVALPSARMPAA